MDTVRWWKDPEFRASVGEAGSGGYPAHPSGLAELSEIEMLYVVGGGTEAMSSMGCCGPKGGFTNGPDQTACGNTGCGCTGLSVCECTGAMASCGACTA